MKKIKKTLNKYFNKNFTFKSVHKYLYEITTPFLDQHNDHIQVYISKLGREDFYFIFDDNYTKERLKMLKLSGFSLSDQKIEIFKVAGKNLDLKSLGLCLDDKFGLFVTSDFKNLSENLNFFLQDLLKINIWLNLFK